jgi:pyrroline-5-carboxylate reductase
MKITIIGCGNMGLIYARSFLKYNIVKPEHLLLVEKNDERKQLLLKEGYGKVVLPDDPLIKESELLILAVKPQDFPDLAPMIASVLGEKCVLISIMAGIKIQRLKELLNHPLIVRAMPNSPVEIGMGITGFCSTGLSIEQIRKAENLLSTTGRTVYFDDEDLMDGVTALSGSGPAYFFYLVKNMIEAGQKMGFDESVSAMLVKQTMLGAFHLLNTANKSLDELIVTVSSKGGTTEAAIKTFEASELGQNLQKGIIEAEKRARELSRS